MGLPTSYLTSTKNLEAILNSIQGAKAPDKFTQTFLEGLGFKAKADRLVIALLKALGFLTDVGAPTKTYYAFLDQSQGARVLAQAIEEAYSDLFAVNKEAQKLTQTEVKNKLRTLTQGRFSDAVLSKMASTFGALCSLADFTGKPSVVEAEKVSQDEDDQEQQKQHDVGTGKISIKGLQYVINLQLPESRDPAVYDALFKALRTHLGD